MLVLGDEGRFSIVVLSPQPLGRHRHTQVTGPIDAHTLLTLIALDRLLDAVDRAATRDVDVRFHNPSPMVERITGLDACTDRIMHGQP